MILFILDHRMGFKMSDKDKKNMNFNIYYLNFSKVYEISMMINNIIISSMQSEKINTQETFEKTRASLTTYLGDIKSVISAESGNKNFKSSKLIESLDVITTKSILLREIIYKCKYFNDFSECVEGDLLKIDKLSLSILDEETLRGILVLRKDALKGFSIEGFEVNNLISSMLQDYSYILKGVFTDDNKKDDVFILKIPLEIGDEFEHKYNVYDLLIGHLSVIGVYKGKVNEDLIRLNTFDYFSNMDSQQSLPMGKVSPSSKKQPTLKKPPSKLDNEKTIFHFIDTIALIQDVQFEQTSEDVNSPSIWQKIWNIIRYGGQK